MNRLEGKVAVVSGAGAGIGREIALLFAAEGAKVGCMDIDGQAMEETVGMARALGVDAYAAVADISDPRSVQAARDAFLDRLGTVDILINNAGAGMAGSVHSLAIDQWQKTLDVNLSGAFYVSKAFWPDFLRKGRGVIVNNSSVMGLAGDLNSAAYCSAKAALVGLTKCLAADGAPHGIRANCVCPGFVDTPAMRTLFNSDWPREKLEKRLPLRRLATTREVANVFLFIASDEASYMTGTTLVVDGGAMLGYQGSDVASLPQ